MEITAAIDGQRIVVCTTNGNRIAPLRPERLLQRQLRWPCGARYGGGLGWLRNRSCCRCRCSCRGSNCGCGRSHSTGGSGLGRLRNSGGRRRSGVAVAAAAAAAGRATVVALGWAGYAAAAGSLLRLVLLQPRLRQLVLRLRAAAGAAAAGSFRRRIGHRRLIRFGYCIRTAVARSAHATVQIEVHIALPLLRILQVLFNASSCPRSRLMSALSVDLVHQLTTPGSSHLAAQVARSCADNRRSEHERHGEDGCAQRATPEHRAREKPVPGKEASLDMRMRRSTRIAR